MKTKTTKMLVECEENMKNYKIKQSCFEAVQQNNESFETLVVELGFARKLK